MARRICASMAVVLLIPAAHCQSIHPRIAVATALVHALTSSPVQGPLPNVQASKDDAEIQACTLSMGTITRMMQATEALFLVKPDADHRRSDDDDPKAEQSLDEQSAKLARRPEIAAVLGKYGFTPRTYTVVFHAYLSAESAAEGLDTKASLEKPAIKAHVNPANIAFVRAHKKAIDELMQKYVFPYW